MMDIVKLDPLFSISSIKIYKFCKNFSLTKKSTSSGYFIKPGSEIAVIAQKSNVIDPKNMLTITISEYFHSINKIN